MENYFDRILNQIRTAVAELYAQTGQSPNKIILGADVYSMLKRYVTLWAFGGEEPRHFATLFNIPLSVDMKDVNRISVCIEHNIKIREEDI